MSRKTNPAAFTASTVGRRWANDGVMNKVGCAERCGFQGRSVMERGGGRPAAFLSKVSLRTRLWKISLRGFQTCVALVMLSCGASVAVFRAASFALILAPRARTELNTGASGLVASGLVASTWKPAIFALIVALILAEAEGGLRRELEYCWCSGSPCVSI